MAIVLAIVPLVAAKALITYEVDVAFAFGMSYATFRALDVIFSVHDGVIKALSPVQYVVFLVFFPTISSGPIDRYRRFIKDWQQRRDRTQFLNDLDIAIERIFRGFLYKFLIAALIRTYWMNHLEAHHDALHLVGYMYCYSLYLFFDFAGYSAFAIGVSYLLGVRTPENFHLPFLARNIRDFWNRWHISLSFWFRDHIYMRFLIAAAKGKWFKGRHTASYIGLWLTFGLMGVWHGIEPHYLLYGAYHAALLCGYDAFARWNKQMKRWPDTRAWRIANIVITFHVVCFGLLLFSGKLFR
jgi:membrane protein involved in D-alanine export